MQNVAFGWARAGGEFRGSQRKQLYWLILNCIWFAKGGRRNTSTRTVEPGAPAGG
jgi:hypothetical protein